MKYFNLFVTIILLGFTSYSDAVYYIQRNEPRPVQRTYDDRDNIYIYPQNQRYPSYYPGYPGYDAFPDDTEADRLYEENLRR